MAVNITTVAPPSGLIRKDTSIFDVEATADGDTTATITHGLGVVPEEVTLLPTAAAARLSLWIETIASRSNTQVVLNKATTAGSGAAGNQVRVVIKKPHTIGR